MQRKKRAFFILNKQNVKNIHIKSNQLVWQTDRLARKNQHSVWMSSTLIRSLAITTLHVKHIKFIWCKLDQYQIVWQLLGRFERTAIVMSSFWAKRHIAMKSINLPNTMNVLFVSLDVVHVFNVKIINWRWNVDIAFDVGVAWSYSCLCYIFSLSRLVCLAYHSLSWCTRINIQLIDDNLFDRSVINGEFKNISVTY